ncbi:MAG: hypothetical protein AB1547_11230 [Thermodesulfobacteriota bacterium]
MEYRIAELQQDVFQTNMDPPDPTISGGFKHVFAAVSKGFPSHPAYARHLRKAREKRLFAGPSELKNVRRKRSLATEVVLAVLMVRSEGPGAPPGRRYWGVFYFLRKESAYSAMTSTVISGSTSL